MIAFKKFCHLVLKREVWTIRTKENGERERVKAPPEIFRLLNESIGQAEIFVYSLYDHELSHSVEAELKLVNVADVKTDTPAKDWQKPEPVNIDLPFKVTFFEAINPLTNQTTWGKFTIEKYDTRGGGRRFVSSDLVNESGPMLVVELEPKHFIKFIILRQRGDEFITYYAVADEPDDDKFNMVKIYLSRLEKGNVASEVVNEKIRFKNTTSSPKTIKRDQKRISRIVRVFSDEQKPNAKPLFSKSVDWSHRWTVRGHWRRLTNGKLGKDRSGEYCVAGFTWVSEFEKGPEDAPLIKKTRVVEQDVTKS